MNSFLRSVGVGIFVAIVVLGVLPPNARPAQAIIVNDPWDIAVNTLSKGYDLITSSASALISNKEFVLDPIAWALAKGAIASMTQSMVNWINSGFNGSPAFVTNLDAYLSNVSFVTENRFINQLSANAALNSPFQSQVASLLNLNFLKASASNGFFLQHPYTLNQYSSNPTGFVNGTSDFTSGGGWGAWFALTTQPENNIYGSYDLSANELQNRLSSTQSHSLTQLGWGQGFLSWCGNSSGGGGGANSGGACKTDDDCAGALACISGKCAIDSSLNNPASTCTNKDGSTGTVQTPGSVIQSQLNKTLGLSGDTLVTADEFNEIIGALMGQLVNQVVGGVGLSGASSVSSGGTGYVDQATNQQLSGGGSAGTTVSNAISTQLQQVTQYQSDWQTIGNEANAAQAALSGQCVRPPAGAASAISSVSAQANAASTRATSAISGLNSVRNEITTAGNSTPALAKVSNDYQVLVSGSNFPSAADIATADAQAQDVTTQSGSTTPITALPLYSQMKFIVGMCQGTII